MREAAKSAQGLEDWLPAPWTLQESLRTGGESASGGVDDLPDLGGPLLLADLDVEGDVEDLPHLVALAVLLQREAVPGLDGDDLNGADLVEDELLELALGALGDEDGLAALGFEVCGGVEAHGFLKQERFAG